MTDTTGYDAIHRELLAAIYRDPLAVLADDLPDTERLAWYREQERSLERVGALGWLTRKRIRVTRPTVLEGDVSTVLIASLEFLDGDTWRFYCRVPPVRFGSPEAVASTADNVPSGRIVLTDL